MTDIRTPGSPEQAYAALAALSTLDDPTPEDQYRVRFLARQILEAYEAGRPGAPIPWDLGVAAGDVMSYIDFETSASVDRKAEVSTSLDVMFDAALSARRGGVA